MEQGLLTFKLERGLCLLFFMFLGFAQFGEVIDISKKQRIDFTKWLQN